MPAQFLAFWDEQLGEKLESNSNRILCTQIDQQQTNFEDEKQVTKFSVNSRSALKKG